MPKQLFHQNSFKIHLKFIKYSIQYLNNALHSHTHTHTNAPHFSSSLSWLAGSASTFLPIACSMGWWCIHSMNWTSTYDDGDHDSDNDGDDDEDDYDDEVDF